MKKLLAVLLASSMLMCGCVAKIDEEFEEVEKIDLEVSDYVEETQAEVKEEVKEETKEPEKSEVKETKPVEKVEEKKETPKEEVKPQIKEETKAPEKKPEPVKVNYSEMNLSGKTICIDAAHGIFAENKSEGIAPGMSLLKDGFKEGTKGTTTTEDVVTLAVAKLLKEKLEAKGATVIMTRTDENAGLSNAERAQFANDNGADICIKLHADGVNDGGSGMSMLVPSNKYITDKKLISASKLLGKTVLNGAVAKTGAKNNGVEETGTMAGLNWSKIPAIILEMGYMTNPQDEVKLADAAYQALIADGIVEGILEYYR